MQGTQKIGTQIFYLFPFCDIFVPLVYALLRYNTFLTFTFVSQ